MPRPFISPLFLLPSLLLLGCSEGPGGSAAAGGAEGGFEIPIEVPAEGRAFVNLADRRVESTPGKDASSADWDLAFEGYEVFTNSGLSGPGEGGALGPYNADVFASGIDPASPIITRDTIGGPFLTWYAYDYEDPAHALYSRFHVFGVQDGDRLWKVQILSYYGDVEGAPVSAMYRLRYAELPAEGAALPTQEVVNIDGTAGGATGSEDTPSECIDLGAGERVKLAPKDAVVSGAWHLCFRRETISVNGELGGPRNTFAADLDARDTPFETFDEVKLRTAESSRPAFEAITRDDLTSAGLAYRGDRVVSIFADQWLNPSVTPPEPLDASWVVVTAGGERRFIVTFARFEGATEASPGTIIMRVKPVE